MEKLKGSLEEIKKEIARLELLKKNLKQVDDPEEDKERTKKLVEIGKIFERYFEIDNLGEAEDIAIYFQYDVLKMKWQKGNIHNK